MSSGDWEITHSCGTDSYNVDWLSFQLTSVELCPLHGKQTDDCELCKADEDDQLIDCPQCGRRWFILGDGCHHCGLIDKD